MGTSVLKQLRYGVVESGFHDAATNLDVLRRAFDIEFTPATKVHEYNYDKAGFYGDRKVTGADSDRLTSSMESELTFSTYLYGYKYDTAAYPGDPHLSAIDDPILPSTTATARHFLVTAFKHLLGGFIAPTGTLGQRDSEETAQGDGTVNKAFTISGTGLKNESAGSAIMFEDANADIGDSLLRWLKAGITTSGEVNRGVKLPAPVSVKPIYYATTCWSRDSFDWLSDDGNSDQWMYFEYKRDDSEAAYKLFGCRPVSATITAEANELPVIEWTFKVGHFERDNTITFQDPQLNHEADADDPYPAIGMGVFLTSNTGATSFSEEVFGSWTLTIENEVSAKMSTNAKHGIADWVLTGRSTTLSLNGYWSPDFIKILESQESVDVDIQNVIPPPDPATPPLDKVGDRGIVAFNIPTARVDEYPSDSDIEDQLSQELVLSAQVNYDEGGITNRSQRNGTSTFKAGYAHGPMDSEIRVAFG